MAKVLPFTGHVVAGPDARAVVAPPYDALTPEQRTAMAAADPRSFLNVLPPAGPEARIDLEHTLRACRRSLDRLLVDGHYRTLTEPTLAVIGLGTGTERITAVIGDLPVDAFAPAAGAARILPHERVRHERVSHLVRYLEVVGVASSPVALAHRPHPAVDAATATVTAGAPAVAYRDENGIDVALWLVQEPDRQRRLAGAAAEAGRLYLADGHHRAAAVAAHDPQNGRVLSALFSTDRLHILPFHRRIDGVAALLDAAAVLDVVHARDLRPVALPRPAVPTTRGIVHLVVAGRWFAVDLRERRVDDDPVEALDVRLAEREVIEPLLAVARARDGVAPRVVALPAPLGPEALDVDGAVGVALPPPRVDDVLRVAEAGEVMPPKTTYVLPKLRSGLVVVPR